MNRFLNLIKRTPILIPLIILMFFYMPPALLLQPEVDRNAIVTAVGIDKDGQDYSMSFLRFVPKANLNYSEKLEVVTCSGKNVSENLEKASIIMGKNLNLNHVESIILGKRVLEEDISKILDFFARAPIVLTGCLLAGTNETAREVVEAINSLNDESGLKVEDILRYAEQNYYGRETTLESFYTGYYSPTGTSFLSYIEMIKGDKNGLKSSEKGSESSSGDSSGGGSESSSSDSSGGGGESKESGGQSAQSQKVLSSDGKMALLKRGKLQTVLSKEAVRGLNYVSSSSTRSTLSISDYDLGNGKLADIIFEIVESSTTSKVSFKNNIPIVSYDVKLKLDLFEIYDKIANQKQSLEQYDMDERIVSEIEKVVKNEFYKSLSILRETKTDTLQVYELLLKTNRKKFNDFLNTLDSKDDFISHIVFAVSVESNPF